VIVQQVRDFLTLIYPFITTITKQQNINKRNEIPSKNSSKYEAQKKLRLATTAKQNFVPQRTLELI